MIKIMTTLAAALLAGSAAQAVIIDFEGETSGGKSNGYTVSGVSFFDTLGADLSVGNFSPQSIGNGLAVFGDDASELRMDFASDAINFSLVFGNDDPTRAAQNTTAYLRLFRGGSLVGSTSVAANNNDLADQSIFLNGIVFDQAFFSYTNPGLTPINLIEAVDNISFDLANAVPEPATWAMMIGGFGMAGGAMRRRAKAAPRLA